jgi:pimeloyl-ACP methyl ester carboxylesterase
VREVPEWATAGALRVARVLRHSLADRLEDTVAGLGVPVRLVVGERDPLSRPPWLTSLSRPAGPPVVMGGLPHSAPHAAPDRFARLVRDLDVTTGGAVRPARSPGDGG